MQFRDLQKQYDVLKPQIDTAVQSVCAQANYISGREVKELEKQLAEYVGVKHCIACANGTDALTLALKAWGIGAGDAVFVPDFTFFSSGECPAAEGATPIFVDVDERTYDVDPACLEEAILQVQREGKLVPKVVVTVDLFGLPANYEAIRPICNRYGLLLLEDGAQGFGGTLHGKRVCSFGDISTTSFFPAKPLGCYGDGGAVFTDSDEWAALIRSYAIHGKSGEDKYNNVRLGMNSRLDTLQAAVLQVKLKAFKEYELEAVNQVAQWYTRELKGTGLILPLIQEGYRSSWAQYTIQLKSRAARETLQTRLKQAGIPTMVYYPKPMHTQGAFANKRSAQAHCPVTDRLGETVLSLPMGPYVTEKDIKTVAEQIKNILEDMENG